MKSLSCQRKERQKQISATFTRVLPSPSEEWDFFAKATGTPTTSFFSANSSESLVAVNTSELEDTVMTLIKQLTGEIK